MITCETVKKEVIRSHYNLVTPFYRLLWGEHIHHGLWDGGESAGVAQRRLVETLAVECGIRGREAVLDVGCGMGGSSNFLADHCDCDVTGITLSRLQVWWAQWTAFHRGLGKQTRFICADVEEADFPHGAFDVVWSVECTEHLFDKARFFERCYDWLRPGGTVAICAWLAGPSIEDEERLAQVQGVCEGFFCPSLGTMEDYSRWMSASGLIVLRAEDWTPRVRRTWEICGQRVRWTGMRPLARLIHRDTRLFLDRFDTLLNAYHSGAMQYGCLIAKRPH